MLAAWQTRVCAVNTMKKHKSVFQLLTRPRIAPLVVHLMEGLLFLAVQPQHPKTKTCAPFQRRIISGILKSTPNGPASSGAQTLLNARRSLVRAAWHNFVCAAPFALLLWQKTALNPKLLP